MQAIPQIDLIKETAIGVAAGRELEEREKRALRRVDPRSLRELTQSVVPRSREYPGLHGNVHGCSALTQSRSDRAIAAQGGNEIACVVIHLKLPNAKYLDRQEFKRWGKA
jgi:hypothetical protein